MCSVAKGDQAERAETQMVEYGTRMRTERDALRKWAAAAHDFIAALHPRTAHEANAQAGLGMWFASLTRESHESSSVEVVEIARCPIHGLHGERDECFECGGPVEKVRMVEVG